MKLSEEEVDALASMISESEGYILISFEKGGLGSLNIKGRESEYKGMIEGAVNVLTGQAKFAGARESLGEEEG